MRPAEIRNHVYGEAHAKVLDNLGWEVRKPVGEGETVIDEEHQSAPSPIAARSEGGEEAALLMAWPGSKENRDAARWRASEREHASDLFIQS